VVDDWMSTYIIRAAVKGKVVFVVPLQENQYLTPGKILGYINPSDARYYVQAILRQVNFGKLDIGQKAQVRFDAYPFEEFGYVNGRLGYISKIPADSGFLANIDLSAGLHTNTNREIQYRNGLQCRIIIITKETNLMQKMFYDIIREIKK
jgi:HlyD family secretion protein